MSFLLYIVDLPVGFIYTFSVDQDREKQGFFTVTPNLVSRIQSCIPIKHYHYIQCHVLHVFCATGCVFAFEV